MFLLHYVSMIKVCMISHQIFYFQLFLLAFRSADIIFHKFLELHSTSNKKIFVTSFPFLTDSLKPPISSHPPPFPQFEMGFQPLPLFKVPTSRTSFSPLFKIFVFPSSFSVTPPFKLFYFLISIELFSGIWSP